MNKNPNITEKNLRFYYEEKEMSTIEVASYLHATSATVYQALIRFGIPIRDQSMAAQLRRPRTYQTNWEPLVQKYMGGTPLEEIAEEVGCALSTASLHLRANGAKMRTRGAETNRPNSRSTIKFNVKKAIQMNKDGMTLTEIGEQLKEEVGRSISVQVISRRFKKVGYKPIMHKASKDKFKNIQVHKRKVAHAIDASSCAICPESRGVQLCHILARRHGGKLVPENAIPLCNTHHRCFDFGELTRVELKHLKPYLLAAKEKGYSHHIYTV